jgi:hypothetical protein
MGDWGPLVYAVCKGVAYIVWSGVGAKLHGHRDRLILKAVLFGLLRVAMGLLIGLFAILLLVNAFSRTLPSEPLLYLAVYVPVRWAEWSVLGWLMDSGHRTAKNLLIGEAAASRLWRIGGIVISCLADIPMILELNGLPLGRFMC